MVHLSNKLLVVVLVVDQVQTVQMVNTVLAIVPTEEAAVSAFYTSAAMEVMLVRQYQPQLQLLKVQFGQPVAELLSVAPVGGGWAESTGCSSSSTERN